MLGAAAIEEQECSLSGELNLDLCNLTRGLANNSFQNVGLVIRQLYRRYFDSVNVDSKAKGVPLLITPGDIGRIVEIGSKDLALSPRNGYLRIIRIEKIPSPIKDKVIKIPGPSMHQQPPKSRNNTVIEVSDSFLAQCRVAEMCHREQMSTVFGIEIAEYKKSAWKRDHISSLYQHCEVCGAASDGAGISCRKAHNDFSVSLNPELKRMYNDVWKSL